MEKIFKNEYVLAYNTITCGNTLVKKKEAARCTMRFAHFKDYFGYFSVLILGTKLKSMKRQKMR